MLVHAWESLAMLKEISWLLHTVTVLKNDKSKKKKDKPQTYWATGKKYSVQMWCQSKSAIY